jgi:conjugative transfer signal peptidase TraF
LYTQDRWARLGTKFCAVCAAAVVTPVLLTLLTPLRLNVSASLPLGAYLITQETVVRGQLVAVCLPEPVARFGWERGYIGAGLCPGLYQAVLKRVAACGGDVVDIQPQEVRVNGEPIANSATRDVDSAGRPLPHVPWGSVTIREGEVWLISNYAPNSWDSRYFGAVPEAHIFATARPLWTVE